MTFGLTITTPSLSILGTGAFGYHKFINDPNNPTENVYQSNYQYDSQVMLFVLLLFGEEE